MNSYLTIPASATRVEPRKRFPLSSATVLVGIGGTAASLRIAELIRVLRLEGIAVEAVLDETAKRFLTEESLRSTPLQLDSLNLLLLAPCTGQLIRGMLEKQSGEPLLELASRTTAPLTVLVPDLSANEWRSESLQRNVLELRDRGVIVLEPNVSGGGDPSGIFAPETLAPLVRAILGRELGDLRGRAIVVSAGGNKESIDAVRWISNRSSGKQGHAIAEAARDRGAAVTLVTCAPESAPLGLESVIAVESHAQLKSAVERASKEADAYIAAAAVADFTPTERVAGKLHRVAGEQISIALKPTGDILGGLPNRPGFVKVAFAAEAEGSAEANQAKALAKLERKGAAMIVLNDVLAADAGFGKETNRISIIERDGRVNSYPKAGEVALAKYDVANIVLDHLKPLLRHQK